ncbi:uncharacterized protein METZ01_LOCUS306186 [marine metagenome]|uniref:Uncharacterized protein n=1 Tax=marine metagenome TaxID=408172 RepID=A0A382N0W1_9ZZZZ
MLTSQDRFLSLHRSFWDNYLPLNIFFDLNRYARLKYFAKGHKTEIILLAA